MPSPPASGFHAAAARTNPQPARNRTRRRVRRRRAQVLEKTFYMDDPDEIVPDRFIGCAIDWAPGKDTTVTVVKKRVPGKGGKGGAPKGGGVTVKQTKPCDSFFNFFK